MADMKAYVEINVVNNASAGLKQVGKDVDELKAKTASMQQSLSGSFSSVFAGTASAAAGLGVLKSAMDAVLSVWRPLVQTGFEWNALMEESRLGIAAIIATFNNLSDAQGKQLKGVEALSAATVVAAKTQKLLVDASFQAAGGASDLIRMYERMASGMSIAGSKQEDLTKAQVKFTATVANLAATLGVPFEQAAQQMNLFLMGMGRTTGRVSGYMRSLGVTPEMVKSWQQLGTGLDQVQERLRAFLEIGPELEKTWVATRSNFQTMLDMLSGEATKGIFGEFKKAMTEATSAIFENGEQIGPGLFEKRIKPSVQEVIDMISKDLVGAFGLAKGAAEGLYSVLRDPAGKSPFAAWHEDVQKLINLVRGELLGVLIKLTALLHPSDFVSGAIGALPGMSGGAAKNAREAQERMRLRAEAIMRALGFDLTGVKNDESGWDENAARQGRATVTPKPPPVTPDMDRAADRWKTYLDNIANKTELGGAEGLERQIAGVIKRTGKMALDASTEYDAARKKMVGTEQQYLDVLRSIGKYRAEEIAMFKAHAAEKVSNLMDQMEAMGRVTALQQVQNAALRQEVQLRKLASEAFRFNNLSTATGSPEELEQRAAKSVDIAERFFQTIHDIRERARLDSQLLESEQIGDWQTYAATVIEIGTKAGKGYMEAVGDALDKTAKKMYDNASSLAQGVSAAYVKIMASLRSEGQAVADSLVEVWGSVGKAIDDSLFAVLTGKFSSLKDILKGLFDDILRSFTGMVGKMIQRWLFLNVVMRSGGATGEGGGIMGAGVGNGEGFGVGAGNNGMSGTGGFLGSGVGLGGLLAGAGMGAYVGNQVSGGSTLGTIGGGIAGIGLAGIASALISSAVIPVWGWVAAAIGGVMLGISSLLKKSTLQTETLQGTQVLSQSSERGNTLFQMASSTIGAFGDMAGMGGKDRTDAVKWYRKAVTDYFKTAKYSVSAGNPDDIQNDWKQVMETWAPRAVLHTMFGQQAYGQNTAVPATGIQNWSPIDYATNQSPIVKTLQDLGYANGAIDKIVQQIDARDPAKFIEWLKALVEIPTRLKASIANLGKTRDQIYKEIDDKANESPADSFKATRDNLISLAKELDMYAGDEQISRANELNDQVEAYWQSQLDYITKVKELAEDLTNEMTNLFVKWDEALMTPEELYAKNAATVSGAKGKLTGVTDPTKIAQIFRDALAAADAMFQVLQARLAQVNALLAENRSLVKLFNWRSGGLEDVLDPMRNGVGGNSASFITNFEKQFNDAMKLTGDAQVRAIGDVQAAARDRYNWEIDMLRQIQGTIKAISNSMGSQIFGMKMDLADGNPEAQKNLIEGQINHARSMLRQAKTPDEVQYWWGQIQQFTQQYWQMFKDAPLEVREGVEKEIEGILESSQAIAESVLNGWKDMIQSEMDVILGVLTTAGGALTTSVSDIKTEIENLKASITSLKDSVDLDLDAVVDSLIAANEALRIALDETKNKFVSFNNTLDGNPVTTGGGGTGGPGGGGGGGKGPLDKLADSAYGGGSALDSFTAAVNAATTALGGTPPTDSAVASSVAYIRDNPYSTAPATGV